MAKLEAFSHKSGLDIAKAFASRLQRPSLSDRGLFALIFDQLAIFANLETERPLSA